MGIKAVDVLLAGGSNRVVAYKNDTIVDFDIEEALSMKKSIPDDWMRMTKLLAR